MTPLIGGIGWQEVLVIAAVIFVLFGAARLPAAFRSLGEGLRSFKDGLSGADETDIRGGGDERKESPSPAPSNGSSSTNKPS